MPADLKWVKENFGTAARLAGAPEERAASAPTRDRDFVRGLIEFDSEGPELTAFAAHAPNASVGLTKYVDINWPRGLAPEPGAKPRGESLPKASVLIVTWTMDEGHALSRVLTPGKDSNTDSARTRSRSLSPIRTCRRTGRTCLTPRSGSRSSPTAIPRG